MCQSRARIIFEFSHPSCKQMSLMQTDELAATKLVDGDGTDTRLKCPLLEVAHRSMSLLAAANASIAVLSLGLTLPDGRLTHDNSIDHPDCDDVGQRDRAPYDSTCMMQPSLQQSVRAAWAIFVDGSREASGIYVEQSMPVVSVCMPRYGSRIFILRHFCICLSVDVLRDGSARQY